MRDGFTTTFKCDVSFQYKVVKYYDRCNNRTTHRINCTRTYDYAKLNMLIWNMNHLLQPTMEGWSCTGIKGLFCATINFSNQSATRIHRKKCSRSPLLVRTFEGLAERNFKLATGVCFSNVYGTTMSLVKMNDSIVLETNIVNPPTVLWIRPKRAIIIHKL